MQIKNSIVLVTGANRGVGKEYVVQLLNAGAAKIYAAARDVSTLTEIVAMAPDRIIPVALDLTEPATIEAATKVASDITLLVNNAGVLTFGGALDVTQAGLDHDMAVNYTGLRNITTAFAPVMQANGGGVVANMLSVLSFLSAPGFSGYNASKAAAWSMTMSLRAYLRPMGIRVVNIFPAGIDTDMLAGVEGPKDSPQTVVLDALAGLQEGHEDIYPGAAADVFATWRQDQKATEQAFAAMM